MGRRKKASSSKRKRERRLTDITMTEREENGRMLYVYACTTVGKACQWMSRLLKFMKNHIPFYSKRREKKGVW